MNYYYYYYYYYYNYYCFSITNTLFIYLLLLTLLTFVRGTQRQFSEEYLFGRRFEMPIFNGFLPKKVT